MSRLLILMLGLAVLTAGPVFAQPANPLLEHFRAYSAAMQRGDLATAETEATAALAASEARDGAGGRTAVLAANLAQVRLDQGHPDSALAPAQRAAALASAETGLDPIYANLLLGRAQLSQNTEAPLQAAITAAQATPGWDAETYDAAGALANWAMSQGKFEEAASAFATAAHASSGTEEAAQIMRAEALIGRGVALMASDHPTAEIHTGTRLTVRPNTEAPLAFSQAMQLTVGLAARDLSTPAITRAERAYATALAWSNAYRARSLSLNRDDPGAPAAPGGLAYDLEPGDNAPVCTGLRLQAHPAPAYPASALSGAGSVGSVVIGFTMNSSGVITGATVLGAAGGGDFVTAVRAVLPQWTLGLRPVGPACSMASRQVTSVVFQLSTDPSLRY